VRGLQLDPAVVAAFLRMLGDEHARRAA